MCAPGGRCVQCLVGKYDSTCAVCGALSSKPAAAATSSLPLVAACCGGTAPVVRVNSARTLGLMMSGDNISGPAFNMAGAVARHLVTGTDSEDLFCDALFVSRVLAQVRAHFYSACAILTFSTSWVRSPG